MGTGPRFGHGVGGRRRAKTRGDEGVKVDRFQLISSCAPRRKRVTLAFSLLSRSLEMTAWKSNLRWKRLTRRGFAGLHLLLGKVRRLSRGSAVFRLTGLRA